MAALLFWCDPLHSVWIMKHRRLGNNDPRVSALGLGCMAFSGGYGVPDDAESIATVHAALDAGITYLDAADFYGMGHSEMLLGAALKGRARDKAFLSIKFGALRTPDLKWAGYDLRPDAIRNFLSYSLKRLGTDHVDIAFVHDVAQDFYGDEWLSVFESARKGAFRTLDRMRDEGVIKAWGLGVNRVEPIELLLALEEPRPDAFLLAGRYTLLDHDRALQRVMPMVTERGLCIVVGGPYSSGALVGGPNFEYAPATPAILAKVAAIRAIADRYGISMKAAGLQFALANPAVAAVIPGASRPGRIAEDRAALREVIPADFWRELRAAGLVNPDAPLPMAG